MRHLFFILFMLFASSYVMAQSSSRDEMNRIKLSADYYWEEASAETPTEAFAMAMGKLVARVNSDYTEADSLAIAANVKRIDMARGSLTRVFVYTAKQTSAQSVQPAPKVETVSTVVDNGSASQLMSLLNVGFDDLFAAIDNLRKSGAISSYGIVNKEDIPRIADAYILMIEGQTKATRALLSPEQNGTRLNTVTNQPDSTSHYHGCHGLWIRTK